MNSQIQLVEQENIFLPDNNNLKNASAILSLLHGKADSNCKIFKKPILVDKLNLQNLNQDIINKLNLHQVSDIVTNIDVSFANRHLLTFKSWNDFAEHDFAMDNSKIQSIVLQWDFFIKLDHYQMPQRHTLNVRIASTPKPSDIFKVLISGGFDEEHDIDIQGSTMIARVDFINNTLAEELLNVVSKWNELCDVAYTTQDKFRQFLFTNRTLLANLTEFFFMLSLVSAVGILMKLFEFGKSIELNSEVFLFLVLLSIPVSTLFKDIGRHFGKKMYNKLDDVIEVHVFNISKGDIKMIEKIKRTSQYKKEIIGFIVNILVSIALSVVFLLIDK